METLLLIGIGGFIGANTRYWMATWAATQYGQTYPLGTLVINVTGSALLGMFIGWSGNHLAADPRLRLLVAVGFFGAYTTFSSFANECIALLVAGDGLGFVLNVFSTNLFCLGGALLGSFVGSRF